MSLLIGLSLFAAWAVLFVTVGMFLSVFANYLSGDNPLGSFLMPVVWVLWLVVLSAATMGWMYFRAQP